MVFSSTIFMFGFLPLLLGLYFLAAPKYRNYILLAFSLIFYGWGGPAYLVLMVAVVMADYVFALLISLAEREKLRKLCVMMAVLGNLGCLGYFKYTNFLVENINYIIQQDYKEKLSLKSISQKLFMNSSYLSRIYKKETGITVTDAINKYRIEKAKEILGMKKYKVYEVGEMVGIEEPSYFTHVFMKYEGYSPSEYVSKLERR